MNDLPLRPTMRAEELRHAFDRTFAEPPGIDTALKENLLAIRLGRAAYALRLSEIGGVYSEKKVTRVPASSPALLGIASFRGTVMPVYDLHILLGFPTSSAVRRLVTMSVAPIALAFDTFEGHLRIPSDAIAPQGASEGMRHHVREFVRTAGDVRGIVDLASVIATIRTQVSQTAS
ncbi:MAG: chemotaxis protein CheW [Rhodospirillaceae bacterium]|nr:MAG: chemotaxis protein CheW [Rhodospirillaceae bacterium]